MRNGTEELGKSQTGKEEESLPGTEIEEGQTERDIDLIDRGKEPKLTEEEWSRLGTCERPCSKEEWRLMTNNMKWQAMGNLGLSNEKKGGRISNQKGGTSGEEQKVPRPPPQSAKPAPPKPPST